MNVVLAVLSLFACRNGSAPVPNAVAPDPIWAEHEVRVFQIPKGPTCTIVALHGRGDTPENFSRVFEQYPGEAQILFPQAPVDSAVGRPSWFAGTRDVSDDELARQVAKMADALAAALAGAPLPHPVRGQPIVTGFSQGGILSYALATRHPEAISAAFPMGGMLPESLFPETSGSIPITGFHGTADRVIPFERARSTVESIASAGWPAKLVPFEQVPHRIPPAMRQALFDELGRACAATRSTSR